MELWVWDMRIVLGRLTRAAGLAALVALAAVSAQAEAVLESRLGAVLGQEREALRVVPSSRMTALTSPPPAEARDIAVGPASITYDRAFLAAQPRASGGAEWECLTEALYFEARGESVRGIFAVAEVILNRVDSTVFPSSICSVVNQGTGRRFACQFSYTCDGRPERVTEPAAWARVGKVARLMVDGAPRDLTGGATYYHTKAVNPSWARRFPRTASIGAHYFYRPATRTASN